MKSQFLSDKLRELRKAYGFTQDYVASALGVVRQTYSHYETGKRIPGADVLFKLAGLYHISVDDLMQLTIGVDRNVQYDAPEPTQTSTELASFLEYYDRPQNKKKYLYCTNIEKEMMYYFNQLSDEDKREIIEFTKIKVRRNRGMLT